MLRDTPSHDVAQSTPPDSQVSQPNSDAEKQVIEDARVPIANASKISSFKSLGWLDRFLAVWIFLAMAIGIILGNFVPTTGPALQKGTFVGVSIPIAIGLLVMMYPILCKVKFETLHRALRHKEMWMQILFSVIVNWIIAPLVMVCYSFPILRIEYIPRLLSDFSVAWPCMGISP